MAMKMELPWLFHLYRVCSLIKSKHPELTNAQIKAAILNNVDKISSLNGKVASGGRLNAYKALQSLEQGSIFIQSNPTGAKIYIDDTDTGFVTPKTISNLIAGSHVVRCSLNGYDNGYQSVKVITGQTASVQLTLNKIIVIPPASITNLQNTTFKTTSITWTWTDPTSTDFSKVMVYLDGKFQTNVTKGVQTYTASSLTPGTQHTIATRTCGSHRPDQSELGEQYQVDRTATVSCTGFELFRDPDEWNRTSYCAVH